MSRAPVWSEKRGRTPRLARALRATRDATPPYDTRAGLARLTAAIAAGAATTAGVVATGHAAKAATVAAGGTGTGATVALGATQGFAIKAVVSSLLLVASVGTAAVVTRGDDASPVRTAAPTGRMAPLPSGAVPSGAVPSAAVPSGAVPSAAAPTAAAPSAAAPWSEAPSRAAPAPASASAASAAAVPTAGGDVALRPMASAGRADVPVLITADAASSPAAPSSIPLASPAAPTSIRPEMEQLALVRRAGDPASALALADAGHATFPRGVFWQEREAIAIASLAQLGRSDDARSRARAFLVRHPGSLFAEELRRVAGE